MLVKHSCFRILPNTFRIDLDILIIVVYHKIVVYLLFLIVLPIIVSSLKAIWSQIKLNSLLCLLYANLSEQGWTKKKMVTSYQATTQGQVRPGTLHPHLHTCVCAYMHIQYKLLRAELLFCSGKG